MYQSFYFLLESKKINRDWNFRCAKIALKGDFTLNTPKEVLMILPRRTIFQKSTLPENWHLKQEEALSLYQNEVCLAKAFYSFAFDFEGLERPILIFEPYVEEEKIKAFEILASHLAIAFDQIPGRYSLYMKIKNDELSFIAKASQMGFTPYLGTWKQSSNEESEEAWNQITEALRQVYPNGFEN